MELLKYDGHEQPPKRASRSYHIDDMERVYVKVESIQNPKLILDTAKDIEHYLNHYGISFEGRALPISLTPTVIPASEVSGLAQAATQIRNVLNRILSRFLEEHKAHHFDGPIHRFFTPYYKWWDMIAAESRRNDHIQLMRYDAVRDHHGRWSFMETNTACPGGVIHCARIRDAWISTKMGRTLTKHEQLSTFAADQASGFVNFLYQKAAMINEEQPNIAILNYHGVYSNELVSLQKCHQSLVTSGKIPRGELILGDVRDITCDGERAYIHGKPLALIYNKIDQLQIDPANPEVAGWIQASQSHGTEFLNSLASIYLGETKRTLALLSDPKWSGCLGLSAEEEAAIQDVVPFTRLVEDCIGNGNIEISMPARKKDMFVLKADALTRGSGVTIGTQTSREDWRQALMDVRKNNGIAQLKCDLPTRDSFYIDENNEVQRISEYFGVDIFLFGDEFSGLVSRAHINQIFNVGNGGREAPVIIVGGGQ